MSVTTVVWLYECECKICKSTHGRVTYWGCILYRDPSMPTVVRTRVVPLFSFSLSSMPDRTAAIRLAERKDTMVQTWRGETPQSSRQHWSGTCAPASVLKLGLGAAGNTHMLHSDAVLG